eukprot:1539527-Pyramimonas_sp.AAC.1
MHKTGDIRGVLPARVGMEVRFTVVQEVLKKKLGLVQEQLATIVFFACFSSFTQTTSGTTRSARRASSPATCRREFECRPTVSRSPRSIKSRRGATAERRGR